MVTSLFSEERITTTATKAREARRYAEKMITFAKRGDLNSRRQAARFVNDPKVLQKLFAEIGPRYADRPGGYTRIMKLGKRRGDDAMTAILELVEPDFKPRPKREKTLLKARDTEPVAEEALAPAEETPPETEED
jgi:large subunit ribosomal protein L17